MVRLTGVRLPFAFILRFSSAILMAYIFITIANTLNIYQETATILLPDQPLDVNLITWRIVSIKSILTLFIIVYVMVFFVEVLKKIKITDLL